MDVFYGIPPKNKIFPTIHSKRPMLIKKEFHPLFEYFSRHRKMLNLDEVFLFIRVLLKGLKFPPLFDFGALRILRKRTSHLRIFGRVVVGAAVVVVAAVVGLVLNRSMGRGGRVRRRRVKRLGRFVVSSEIIVGSEVTEFGVVLVTLSVAVVDGVSVTESDSAKRKKLTIRNRS